MDARPPDRPADFAAVAFGSCADIDDVRGEWEDLANDAEAAPFVRPDWLAVWWGTFGGDRGGLSLATLRADSGIQALMALVARRGHLYSPGNIHMPWSEVIARDDDAADNLLAAVFTCRAHRVTLAPIVWGSPTAASARRAALTAGRLVLERGSWDSPYVDLVGVPSADQLVGRHFRKELRRCTRRLGEQGAVTYVVHRTTDGLDRVLGEAFRVESSQWKGRAGTAMASRPDTESFYRGVAYAAAAGGTLHLATLRLDGRVVSFELGVRVAGRHFALKSGFDPVYRRFSPGHLLCERIINDAIAARMSRYEMLGHSDTYKHRWSDRAHRIVVLEFLARSPRGLASYVALLARREARSLVAPVARRTRRALGRLRGVSLRRNA